MTRTAALVGRVRALVAPGAAPQLSAPWRFAIAPAATLLVFLVQLAVFPHPSIAPFVFFYVAVVVASWLGGRAPGLTAVALAALAANYAFVSPQWAWSTSVPALTATALFVVAASLVALLCASFRDSLLRSQRTAALLRESEARFRTMADGAPLLIWSNGLAGCEFANRGYLEFLGCSMEEVLRMGWARFLHPDDAGGYLSAYLKAFEAREAFEAEVRVRRADGRFRWIRSTGVPRRSDAGEFLGYAGCSVDVTDFKEVEDALRREREQAVQVARFPEENPDPVLRLSRDLTVVYANPAARTELGVRSGDPSPPVLQPGREAADRGPVRREVRVGERFFSLHFVPAGEEVNVYGHDITARKAMETERDRLLEDLRDADRRKTEFLGMLSHELRNPLAPIRNSVYILSRAAPGSEAARRALAVIERQVKHTTRLVDDLLDVTRITRGKVRLQRERLDLRSIAQRTVEDHRELFAKSGVRLDVVLPDDEVVVSADGTRIAQVIGNLLQNAVKFTPRGGRTTVAVERADPVAVVTVRDTGAGIAPDVLPRLFEPFVQAESTLDRSAGGLGLGLALVKGLAELHGGTVSARSEGVGSGATFVVRLPLDRRSAPRLTLVPSAIPAASAWRVLVIEDSIDAAETLKAALELDDHVVELALTGAEGLEKVRSWGPDVVLCDLGLPGMDGFQVARALRADPGTSAVPLIALSGYAQPEDLERSREAGFDLHLAKPPDLKTLERAIAQVRAARAAAGMEGAAPTAPARE